MKCVSLADDVFVDHFPGYPVMPGFLMLEGMAQLAGVLLEGVLEARRVPDRVSILVMVERAKFRRVIRPGDRLEYEALVLAMNSDAGRVRVEARSEGELAVEAELTLGFRQLTSPKAIARRDEMMRVWLHGSADEA